MKKWSLLYCACFFAVCLCPFVGMVQKQEEDVNAENRRLAEFPVIRTEEGDINTEWFSQAGDYFQDHFAFRSKLVTANALVQGKLLGVSTASGVIQGSDGWLYYKDSLSDYLGMDLLSERSLFNIAHTLGMTQRNLEQRGVKFAFTIAPNKNSLYGEHMPYYDSYSVTDENNLKRLKPFLEEEGVNYIDLYSTFQDQTEVLYHSRDSHWNNKGAALASDQILTALGKDHRSYEDEPYEVRKDFAGDLDKMLYPEALTLEDEVYYENEPEFTYVQEVESNFDPRINTTSEGKDGSLVMYRDSFGNTLLPFMAEAYGSAYFSRGVPYQLSDVDTYQAEAVVMERAERFLPEVSEAPPVLKGSSVAWEGEIIPTAENGISHMEMKHQGLNIQILGAILPEYLETDSEIYLRLNGTSMYEAFPMDIEDENGVDDGGFCLYLGEEQLQESQVEIEVMVRNGDTMQIISKQQLEEEVSK